MQVVQAHHVAPSASGAPGSARVRRADRPSPVGLRRFVGLLRCSEAGDEKHGADGGDQLASGGVDVGSTCQKVGEALVPHEDAFKLVETSTHPARRITLPLRRKDVSSRAVRSHRPRIEPERTSLAFLVRFDVREATLEGAVAFSWTTWVQQRC